MGVSEDAKKFIQDKNKNLETVTINISFSDADSFTEGSIPIFTKHINE